MYISASDTGNNDLLTPVFGPDRQPRRKEQGGSESQIVQFRHHQSIFRSL